MTKLLSTLTVLLFAGSISIFSNVAGKWEASIYTDNGPLDFTVEYKVTGKKISGVFSSEMGEASFTDGKIDGDEFEYTFYVDVYEVTHKGKFEGGKIKVKWYGPEVGEGEFTLKKAK